ncbi:MAG: DUF2064 domain-containing protein [Solirubrobacteraceae bacterium]
MTRVPRRGEVRHALEPLLGLDGCLALHTALLVEAVRWARQISPREIFIAHEPADGGRELASLLGPGVTLFPQNGEGIAGRVADGLIRVSAHSQGPVFVIWPDLPRFHASDARSASADLQGGADLVLGAAFDGGYFMIALARPLPKIFTLGEQFWRGPDSFMRLMAESARQGLDVGMLPVQRTIHGPADLRAVLADPLLPASIAALVRRHLVV